MTARYSSYDNRSPPNVAYNGVDYRPAPEFRIRSNQTINVEAVKDLLLDELLNKIKTIANSTLNYVVGVLATALYVVCIFKIMTIVIDIKLPPIVQNNMMWGMMDRVPLVVWFISASVLAALTDLLEVKMMRLICTAVIGALMLLYAVRTWNTGSNNTNAKSCSRPLLLAGGIYILSVCALQMKLIGVTTVQEATALFYFINWGSIIVYLLGIVDYYTNGCR